MHYHIELPGLPLRKQTNQLTNDPLKNLKERFQRVQNTIARYRGVSQRSQLHGAHQNDFARLARRITGQSIGIVLGGGGARGLSHLVGNMFDPKAFI